MLSANKNQTLTQLHFSLTVLENTLKIPHYSGSWLRGIIGRHLRNLSCMTKQPDCHDCSLIKTCPYGMIFEKGGMNELHSVPTSGFIVRPPSWGEKNYDTSEKIVFSVVLIGELQVYTPYVIASVQRMCQMGLGHERIAVSCEFNHEQKAWIEPTAGQTQSSENTTAVFKTFKLTLQTPLRLQQNSIILNQPNNDDEALNLLKNLLAASYRRVKLQFNKSNKAALKEFQFIKPDEQTLDSLQIINYEIRWRDWERYSARQKQSMKLGGLMGEINFSMSTHDFLLWQPFLQAATLIHIGKNTNFGLGQILYCDLK